MNTGRVCVLLMDSLGVGASLDAQQYGDEGANTFGHIVEARNANPLHIPNLSRLGLYHAAVASSGKRMVDLAKLPLPSGLYGYAVEQSLGKDTPSGHWEIAGLPVNFAWGYFPNTPYCFPKQLISDLIDLCDLPGVLGEKHASGTEIINEFGDEHVRTGKPIIYTSADSVVQIAAHEQAFGLQRLLQLCERARTLVDEYNIGRVIARPFLGANGNYFRTGNRRDYSRLPHGPTLLDGLKSAGREVIAIGKTADIFAHQGVTQTIHANGNMALFDTTLSALQDAPDGSLVFTNFVDFDSSYGHRRDIEGYAAALEAFDVRLSELDDVLLPQDMVVITADHGCDPSFPGSDHTREHVPVLVFGKKLKTQFIGRRDTFADIGQSIAHCLKIQPLSYGVSFL